MTIQNAAVLEMLGRLLEADSIIEEAGNALRNNLGISPITQVAVNAATQRFQEDTAQACIDQKLAMAELRAWYAKQ